MFLKKQHELLFEWQDELAEFFSHDIIFPKRVANNQTVAIQTYLENILSQMQMK